MSDAPAPTPDPKGGRTSSLALMGQSSLPEDTSGLPPVTLALFPPFLAGSHIESLVDDWLILAQSRELVCRHRDVLLHNFWSLGVRPNTQKSVLSPSPALGVQLDALSMRIEFPVSVCAWPTSDSCLMAAAFPSLLLGLLHMRPVDESQGHSSFLVSFPSAESIAQLPSCSLEVEKPSLFHYKVMYLGTWVQRRNLQVGWVVLVDIVPTTFFKVIKITCRKDALKEKHDLHHSS